MNAKDKETLYFSLNDKKKISKTDHAADSISCPRCGNTLVFESTTFSHLGKMEGTTCGIKQPKTNRSDFSIYLSQVRITKYNIIASALVLMDIGFDDQQIHDALCIIVPAFGRQEIVAFQGKKVQLFLSKNPTSFNQSFSTIQELNGKYLLLVLNDRIPDGRDISWIWDTE